MMLDYSLRFFVINDHFMAGFSSPSWLACQYHRAPRQSVCRNLKDLYGNILRFTFKSKYWVECSYIDQNKRKRTSSVVFCRPCG